MVRTVASDRMEQKVLDDIAVHGWHVVKILEEDNAPPYAFSVGMSQTFGHPEIVITGLPAATAHDILNWIGRLIADGKSFASGVTSMDVLDAAGCQFLAVDRQYHAAYFGFARWFYEGDAFEVVQCIWPTDDGRWPWDRDAPRGFVQRQFLLLETGVSP